MRIRTRAGHQKGVCVRGKLHIQSYWCLNEIAGTTSTCVSEGSTPFFCIKIEKEQFTDSFLNVKSKASVSLLVNEQINMHKLIAANNAIVVYSHIDRPSE